MNASLRIIVSFTREEASQLVRELAMHPGENQPMLDQLYNLFVGHFDLPIPGK